MNIDLKIDTASAKAAHIADLPARSVGVMQAAAEAVLNALRAKMRDLQKRGNKMSWPSKGFFVGDQNSVTNSMRVKSVNGTTAVIVIDDKRMVHRIQGGPIGIKRSEWLTIPLTAEAYMACSLAPKYQSIRDTMPGLKITYRDGNVYLAAFVGYTVTLHFLLRRQVNQKAKPEEAETPEYLAKVVRAAMVEQFRKQMLQP